MGANRPVSREDEPIEFRPVRGLEADWAGLTYVERSRTWDYLGVLPVGFLLVIMLLLLGLGIG